MAQSAKWLMATVVLLAMRPCHCQGQTFTACTLFDNLPVDGVVDTLQIPELSIGELYGSTYQRRGLCRARLAVQLPPIPPGMHFGAATLRLYLQGNTGDTGNPSFGPLSVYHDFHPNSLEFRDTEYADTNYLLVTNSFVTAASPTGQYYEIDVSAQVAKDYASDGATPFSDFRMEVDGLQFESSSHFYSFDCTGSHPPHLALLFGGQVVPSFPLLSLDFQGTTSTLNLAWPTNYAGFVLESADLPAAGTWGPVTNVPVEVNGQFRTSLPALGTRQFFRLRQ